jgi:acyl carrier protein
MTREEIRAAVLHALGEVAPEADLEALKADVPFRDQLDLDSMDVLNFVIGLDRVLKVAVPESDYSRIATLSSCVAYLEGRLAPSSSSVR